jgi:opacity protein-like surface antigen
MLRKAVFAVVATVWSGSIAIAADMVLKAPVAPADYNWTGFYIGAFAGGIWGETDSFNSGTNANRDPVKIKANGVHGGVDAGYDWQLPNRFVLGVRVAAPIGTSADGSVSDPLFPQTVFYKADIQWAATFTGNIGYAMGPQGRLVPYIGGGLAVGEGKASFSFPGTVISGTNVHTGFTGLAGIRFAFTENWWVGVQYNYTDFGEEPYTVTLGNLSVTRNVGFQSHSVSGLISYRFGGGGLVAKY